MDRYLFENLVFELDENIAGDLITTMPKLAKDIVEVPNNDKITFNFYPQEEEFLQIVIEGIKEEKGVCVDNFKVHHTSSDVWKLKVLASILDTDDTYLVNKEDGTGGLIIRLVNEQVLGKVEKDSLIEAQVVGLAGYVDIYNDEDDYSKNAITKMLISDGALLPATFLVNNDARLSEEERKEKDHSLDTLLDFRGTIKTCYKYSLKMFDVELNDYFVFDIDTQYGNLSVVVPSRLMPKNRNRVEAGNVLVGRLILSGDVCIYDKEKYIQKIELKEE